MTTDQLGRLAYETYNQRTHNSKLIPWNQLSTLAQSSWIAVAIAVRTASNPNKRT